MLPPDKYIVERCTNRFGSILDGYVVRDSGWYYSTYLSTAYPVFVSYPLATVFDSVEDAEEALALWLLQHGG